MNPGSFSFGPIWWAVFIGIAALLVVAGHVGHEGLGLDPAVLADFAVLDVPLVKQADEEGPADVE